MLTQSGIMAQFQYVPSQQKVVVRHDLILHIPQAMLASQALSVSSL